MNTEHFEHKGIKYSVQLSEDSHGEWSWTWLMPKSELGGLQCPDLPLATRDLALGEARRSAEFHIDGMVD